MTEKSTDKRIYTMSQEKPVKAVLKMGLPLVAGMFVMALYNIVDTYFIGLTRDDYQLAAVNLAYPIMMILVALSNMISTGAASLIARSLGANDKKTADHTVTSGFGLTVLFSIIVTVFGLIFLSPIVRLLGAMDNTFAYTSQYVEVLLAGSLSVMGNYTFGQFLRSEGSAVYSVIGMVAGTVANIVLDPIFIFTFGMQIRGAAVATVLGNAVGMIISVVFYLRKKTLLQPSFKYILPTKRILKEIFWVGVPASLETLLTSVAYIVLNKLSVSYGELTVAAMGVAQKIMSIGTYIYQGMTAGAQPVMGFNYGANNYNRMRSVLKAGIIVTSLMEFLVMAVFGIFAPQLISLFSESRDVVEIGSRALRTIMFILPFVGAVSMSRSSFQAMGKPQFAFAITLVRQLFLYVPLLLLFNHLFGFNGMICAQPVTELIMTIVSVALLLKIINSESNGPLGSTNL